MNENENQEVEVTPQPDNVGQMIKNISGGDNVNATDALHQVMAMKKQDALDARQQELSASLFADNIATDVTSVEEPEEAPTAEAPEEEE